MDRYELRDVDAYDTWSGILELLSMAMRVYEAAPFGRNLNEAADVSERERAADELRTIARLLEAAATEVREDELMRLRAA